MHTLFITHHYLSSNGGGSFASRAYINAFAEVADKITLLYPTKDGEDVFEGINPNIQLVPVKYNIPKWYKLIHLLEGKVHRYFSVATELLEREKFDVVVFDTSLVSYRLIDRFKAVGAKTIVIHHNYQYEYFRDNTKGLLSIPTLFWCKRYECQAVTKANLNLTLTKQDIKLLADNYNHGKTDNIKLLGTFEYTQKPVRIFPVEESSCNRFVITGNLGAIQTEQSLVPWIKEYYPILKEIYQDATLTIAGRDPGKTIQNLCKEQGITLIPSPNSMEPIMENADYYICPTCFGGGLKLRVMDGLKWGLPVITHAVSARGYDSFVDKGYMLPYDNKDTFRQSLIILKQKSFNKQQVYDDYRNIFSFEAGVERLKKILRNSLY